MGLPFDMVKFFGDEYENLNEPAICIDGKLNIVYATGAAEKVFGLQNAKHIGCVFGEKYFTKLKNAVETEKSISFPFYSAADDSHKKCLLCPVRHGSDKCAVLLFSELSSEAIDDLCRFEFKNAVDRMEEKAESLTVGILRHLRLIRDGGEREDSLNEILKAVLNYRRMTRNVAALSGTRSRDRKCIIDINEYIKYILVTATEITGSDKIECDTHLGRAPLYVRIDPFDFEVLICNILSNAVGNSVRKARISVSADSRENGHTVLFTDAGIGMKNAEKLFDRPIEYRRGEFTGTGVAVIRRIVSENGGEVFARSNLCGGATIGFTLPAAETGDPSELRSPSETEHNSMQNILIGLSDVIDAEKIKL